MLVELGASEAEKAFLEKFVDNTGAQTLIMIYYYFDLLIFI